MNRRRRPVQGVLGLAPTKAAGALPATTVDSAATSAQLPREVNTLRGLVERFVWRDAQQQFGVAVLRDEDGRSWTLKGPLWGLREDEPVQVWGKLVDDPRYGPQFRVQHARPVLPASEAGVVRWLRSARFPGIGETLAARLVAVLGPHALTQIRADPEVLDQVPGLPRKRHAALVAALQAYADTEADWVFLHDLGLGPAVVRKIAARWGQDAVRRVRDDPFALAEDIAGIGWKTVDTVARGLGLAHDAPPRLRAGLRHVLTQLADQGHTAPPAFLVREQAAELLDVALPQLEAPLVELIQTGRVQRQAEVLVLPWLAKAEVQLARDLVALRRSARGLEGELGQRLGLAATALGFELQGQQRTALETALSQGVVVVTGGPGTGKTTLVRGLLAALAPERPRVALAAPTGRAARRLAEATGQEAKTLHRLLEFEPHGNQFHRHAGQPLEADLVIVDELSMAEVPLTAALVAALAPGTRLVLVGDADQLPSVGPGAVLHDVIASGVLPVVALDRIWRQGDGSHIAWAAWQVRQGQLPQGAAAGSGGDFFIVPRDDPEAIAHTVQEIVGHRLPARWGLDPVADVQVLAPMHRGPLGTEALNERLREVLNPLGSPVSAGLRVGDKVLQTRNDYDTELFNGDIGRVLGVGQTALPGEAAGVRLQVGDRAVEVPASRLDQLQLAYAVTVHKSQGSEYPAVVLPMHLSQHVMLQRNLLYTALTRGRRFVCLVGQPAALERAVRNDALMHRHTRLTAALREAAQ
jgi:exodeoxyribonuclease V alpha subunit